jgi:hypothetical protein
MNCREKGKFEVRIGMEAIYNRNVIAKGWKQGRERARGREAKGARRGARGEGREARGERHGARGKGLEARG